MNRIAAATAKSKLCSALRWRDRHRSRDDEIDRFNEAVGLKRLAHFPDLDVIRRSRLKSRRCLSWMTRRACLMCVTNICT